MKERSKEEWEERKAAEREGSTHPCDHFDIHKCTCKGACSCHWTEECFEELRDLSDERTMIERELNGIIRTCLGGPPGDPDRSHRQAAASAWKLLKKLGLPIHGEKDWEPYLRPSEENGWQDYLKEEPSQVCGICSRLEFDACICVKNGQR